MLSANWADTFGTAGTDSGDDVEIGPNGSSYVVGGFSEGTIDFDDHNDGGEITAQNKKNSFPQAEGFLVKYDQHGAFQWVVHTANDSGPATLRDVALDSQGNAYIVGHFFNAMTLYGADGAGLLVSETVSRAGAEIYISKITSDGQIAWVEVLGGKNSQSGSIIRVLEDQAAGEVQLIVAGLTDGGGDLDPGPGDTLQDAGGSDRHGFLAGYRVNVDDSLALQWLQTRYLEPGGIWLDELSVSDGKITAIGDNGFGTSYLGIFDAADGTILLEQETGNPVPSGVDRYGDSIFVSGNFTGSLDLDGNGTIDVSNDDVRRAFISKYTYDPTLPAAEQLSLAWATVLTGAGENALSDVKVSATGDLYGAGRYFDTLSLDGIELQPPGGDADSLVVKLDPLSGQLLSAEGFGGSAHDRIRVMQIGDNGTIHLAGWTSSVDAAFPNVAGTFATAGGQDGFVAVYTPVTSAPPIADAGPPQSGAEDQALLFDASGSSDPDGDPLTYRWDFGDGQTAETISPTIAHSYAYGGVFDVTLTVLDGNGNATTDVTTATVTEVNDTPVAHVGGPYAGLATVPVTFDASASVDFDNTDGTAANNQTLIYQWDFGDGITTSTTTPTALHTYAAAGEYTVVLTVSDDVTTSSPASTTAVIEDAPAGDPNALYVWDIQEAFQTKKRGKFTDHRLVIGVRRDSDADGMAEATDAAVAGVAVTVTLTSSSGQVLTLTGTTDSQGVFRSEWLKGLSAGSYRAEVVDLALAGFAWDPFDVLDATANDEDADLDGAPDESLSI